MYGHWVRYSILPFREFAKEKARAQKSGEFQKFREKQLLDEALHGYVDWINEAGKMCILLGCTADLY